MTDALKRAAMIKGSSDALCQETLRNTEGKHLLTPLMAPGPWAPQQDLTSKSQGRKVVKLESLLPFLAPHSKDFSLEPEFSGFLPERP